MSDLKPPAKLGDHRVLIVNDDGIEAHGIKLLEEIAREFTDDVWVVAPDEEKSGFSHSISMTIPDPRTEGRRAPFRGQGHADRLRVARDLRIHRRAAADRAAFGHQPRRQSRRGHHLFRNGGGGDGRARCSAFARLR